MKRRFNFRSLALRTALLGDEKFGGNIIVLDTRLVSSITDYLVIMSVYSYPQLDAVRRHITDELKKSKILPLRKEGSRGVLWAVLDFGGVLVHIMHEEYREFYRIERLWPDARKVSWKKVKNVKRGSKKKNT